MGPCDGQRRVVGQYVGYLATDRAGRELEDGTGILPVDQ